MDIQVPENYSVGDGESTCDLHGDQLVPDGMTMVCRTCCTMQDAEYRGVELHTGTTAQMWRLVECIGPTEPAVVASVRAIGATWTVYAVTDWRGYLVTCHGDAGGDHFFTASDRERQWWTTDNVPGGPLDKWRAAIDFATDRAGDELAHEWTG